MQARLSKINCEFLTRPWILVSEFSDNVLSNMLYLQESYRILNQSSMDRFFEKLQIYKQSMRVLSIKNEAGNGSKD